MTDASAKSILDDLLARTRTLRAEKRSAVVVFDLDHTLFDNGPRTWQLLLEFAEAKGNARLRAALDELPHVGLPYLLSETLARCGFDDEALAKEAFAFWKDRFFTDEYQRFDLPLKGAVEFVRTLFEAGATIVYLSGRDAPGMLVGCAASLRHYGFPVGLARTTLVLKHDFETPDLEFKAEAVEFIDTLGQIIGTFDNEPGNCNLFQKSWPDAVHVYVTTAHAPNPPKLHDAVLSIPDFSIPERGAR